jgi:hypothetical protein
MTRIKESKSVKVAFIVPPEGNAKKIGRFRRDSKGGGNERSPTSNNAEGYLQ